MRIQIHITLYSNDGNNGLKKGIEELDLPNKPSPLEQPYRSVQNPSTLIFITRQIFDMSTQGNIASSNNIKQCL
jgi:hypothetical protein